MKKLILGLLLLPGLLPLFQYGCSGSGAVNPLTPTKATSPDSSAEADSQVVYWSSFPVTFTLTDSLNGVCLVSRKLGWACGNNGVVLKYDGSTWSKVDTGFARNENLNAVAFADDGEGWIVGTHGTILHYKNGSWSQDSSGTEETLYSIAVTRARTVWVAGSNGTLLTYNGVSWGRISSFFTPAGAATTVTQDIYGIGLSDQNSGWAVGSLGLILHYDGQKWETYPASPTTEKLTSVSALSDVQAWAVGSFGTILSFNGTAWNKVGNAFSGFDLYQVCMRNDSDGWASGQDGTLAYYDGTRWISHVKPAGKPSLNAIAFYKDVGFIVGQNGTILKFQPNGEPTQFDFLFKGKVARKPSKTEPYWTLDYTLMNQGPKASPLLTYELPIPKGFEPYRPKATPTPNRSLTPTPSPTPSATPTAEATGTATPGVPASGRQATGVSGDWKMKDGKLEWEIGTVAPSELKEITVLLQEKKGGKKDTPVLLKAVLKSEDRAVAQAAPVTLLPAEKQESSKDAAGAGTKETPTAAPAGRGTGASAKDGGGPEEGGPIDEQPTPTVQP